MNCGSSRESSQPKANSLCTALRHKAAGDMQSWRNAAFYFNTSKSLNFKDAERRLNEACGRLSSLLRTVKTINNNYVTTVALIVFRSHESWKRDFHLCAFILKAGVWGLKPVRCQDPVLHDQMNVSTNRLMFLTAFVHYSSKKSCVERRRSSFRRRNKFKRASFNRLLSPQTSTDVFPEAD